MPPKVRMRPAILAGLLAGVAAGIGLLGLAGVAGADRADTPDADPGSLIEATHLPPLLLAPGEPARLRYDIYCSPPAGDLGATTSDACHAGGSVYVRAGETGSFRRIPLRLDAAAAEGRYVADIPADVARAPQGFSYYAVVRNLDSGAATTLPAGGALAPDRARPLGDAIVVDLGAHAFGAVRRPDARVAEAGWGARDDEVGLEAGPPDQHIGATSFDVDANGVVHLLDEAKSRVLRFRNGSQRPEGVPVATQGTIADLAVEDDGSLDVLETVADGSGQPLLRRFDAAGQSRGAWHVAGERASALRRTADGAAAFADSSEQWLPVMSHGRPVGSTEQHANARAGRALPSGEELVAEREGADARVAIMTPTGRVRASWVIHSVTPLAEIQLAEALPGDRVLLVLRVYTDGQDEFQVLVLDRKGVSARFSTGSTAWAETAPFARFRLRGNFLYELGSTPAGVFVDRYDLEVK